MDSGKPRLCNPAGNSCAVRFDVQLVEFSNNLLGGFGYFPGKCACIIIRKAERLQFCINGVVIAADQVRDLSNFAGLQKVGFQGGIQFGICCFDCTLGFAYVYIARNLCRQFCNLFLIVQTFPNLTSILLYKCRHRCNSYSCSFEDACADGEHHVTDTLHNRGREFGQHGNEVVHNVIRSLKKSLCDLWNYRCSHAQCTGQSLHKRRCTLWQPAGQAFNTLLKIARHHAQQIGDHVGGGVHQSLIATGIECRLKFCHKVACEWDKLVTQTFGNAFGQASEKLVGIILQGGKLTIQGLALLFHALVESAAFAGCMAHGIRDFVNGHLALADAVIQGSHRFARALTDFLQGVEAATDHLLDILQANLARRGHLCITHCDGGHGLNVTLCHVTKHLHAVKGFVCGEAVLHEQLGGGCEVGHFEGRFRTHDAQSFNRISGLFCAASHNLKTGFQLFDGGVVADTLFRNACKGFYGCCSQVNASLYIRKTRLGCIAYTF